MANTHETAMAWFLVYFARGFLTSYVSGINCADEAWLLQIASRIRAGELLYRDIHLGITPLAAYLGVLLTLPVGVNIAAIKMAAALIYAAQNTLMLHLAARLSPPGDACRGVWPLAAALLALTDPYTTSAGAYYSSLASLLMWCGFLFMMQNKSSAATACLTLSFLSKQTTGLFGLGLLGIFLLASRRRAIPAQAAIVVSLLALALVPQLQAGAIYTVLEQTLLSKGFYVQAGRLSYFEQAARLFDVARYWPIEALRENIRYVLYLLPPIALLLLRTTAGHWFLAFVLCDFFGVFPRIDIYHLATAVPALLCAAWLGCQRVERPLPRKVFSGLSALFVIAVALVEVSWLAYRLRSPDLVSSRLPFFSGPLLPRQYELDVEETRAVLAGIDRLYIQSNIAGFLYMVCSRQNLTPFDFPLVSTLAHAGQQRVISQIAQGELAAVCFKIHGEEALRPQKLDGYILDNLSPIQTLPLCELRALRR